MSLFNLFSKRQKALRGEVPDVYSYDEIPYELRVQIVHIIREVIGRAKYSNSNDEPSEAYRAIYNALCKEYGKFNLTNSRDDEETQVLNFLLIASEVEEVLDVVELTFRSMKLVIEPRYYQYTQYAASTTTPEDGVQELNARFKEHGVGYSFDGNEIIRVDSTYTHAEITKPTISLLWNTKFQGANEEYMKAHEHYRHGRNKECLTECLKAFESTMKIICTEKGWPFDKGDAAKKLIQICLQHGLVPEYMQTQISSLKGLFESGIPTVRNKLGGHGQGAVIQTVDDRITRYGLNLTGANIIFMIEQSGL